MGEKIRRSQRNFHFETIQLHAGQERPDPATGARAVPIYQTSSFVFDNCAHAEARFNLSDAGNIYGRLTNSTQEVLENRLAAAVQGAGTLDELVQAMRTKRYATARLRRLVLDAALGYTGDLPALPPYLHVLGANETGLAVLRCARQAALLPLSHSLADLAARSAPAARVAAAHAAAEDLTALCLRHPAPMGAAYTAKPVFPTSGAK